MCRLCGREVCNECFQQVRDLTQAPPNATPAELKAFTTKREKHAHANPFFLSCLKRNEHSMADFTPVTRFVGAELDKTIQEMQEILDKDPLASQITPPRNAAGSIIPSDTNRDHPQSLPPPLIGAVHALPPQPQPALLTRPEPPAISTGIAYSMYRAFSADVFPDPIASPVYDDYIPSNAPQHVTSIPTYPIQVIPANLYDAPKISTSATAPSPAFASLWRLGLPLLVKGVLDRFKIRWNPQYFIERYGAQSCLIIECQTEVNRRVHVAEFFEQFGQYKDRTECWKLKVRSLSCFYFVNNYAILISFLSAFRIGLRQWNLKAHSPSCMRISIMRYQSQIMCDVTAFSTLAPISPLTLSALTSVCSLGSILSFHYIFLILHRTQDVQRIGIVARGRQQRVNAIAHGHGGCSQCHVVCIKLRGRLRRLRCMGFVPGRGQRQDPLVLEEALRVQSPSSAWNSCPG